MKRWAVVWTLAVAGFSLSCSEKGALEPERDPAPLLALVIQGIVEANGTPQEGVPVEVEALHGLGPAPGDCEVGPWGVIARAKTTSDVSGWYTLTLMADSTHKWVAGKSEVEACVHVMGRDPTGDHDLVLYPVSDQWLREESAVDTLEVNMDISAVLADNPQGAGLVGLGNA
ncbi:MAG TPA: hypothetical protein VF212_13140 [Longimicrobiales bacterium]